MALGKPQTTPALCLAFCWARPGLYVVSQETSTRPLMIPEETSMVPDWPSDFHGALAGPQVVLQQTLVRPSAIPEKTSIRPAFRLASCWAQRGLFMVSLQTSASPRIAPAKTSISPTCHGSRWGLDQVFSPPWSRPVGALLEPSNEPD